MGFYNEHQRPDRDQYIKINWNQVPQDFESQFIKIPTDLNQSFLTEYDTESVLHLSSHGNLISKLDGTVIEPNKNLSDLDIFSLNELYPCKSSFENENNQS